MHGTPVIAAYCAAYSSTPSANALKLAPPHAPEAGYEIVPKPEATLLVEYLLSLKSDAPMPEAPLGK